MIALHEERRFSFQIFYQGGSNKTQITPLQIDKYHENYILNDWADSIRLDRGYQKVKIITLITKRCFYNPNNCNYELIFAILFVVKSKPSAELPVEP